MMLFYDIYITYFSASSNITFNNLLLLIIISDNMGEATLNLHVDEYTNRVLGVIKEMFGLKNKSEALNKFAHMFGEKYIEAEVSEDVVNEVIKSCEDHVKKHGMRKMSLSELKELTGAD